MKDLILVAGGVLLLAFVVLAIRFPRVSLLTLVALDVSNINGVIADQLGTSPYKPQLALAVIAVLVMVRRRMFRFAWSPVLLGLMVLAAGFCLSFVAAADPVTSLDLLLSYARDLLYFLVVYALLLSTDSLRTTTMVAVLVLAGLAGLTVIHEFVLHNAGSLYGLSRVPLVQEGGALTPRHAGTSSDVNFWSRLLILFTPMALSLLAMSRSARDRLLWAGATLALLLGVYLTQSRGGFIALFVGLVVWAVLAGGWYRKSLLFLPVALLVIVPLSGIGSRLGTLTAVLSGSTTTADPSVVTRKRLQLDAWNMFLDRPITGHGIGSYPALFLQYDRLANFDDRVDIVVAAHNFYFEQAADGGVVLLLCWAFFFGTVLFVALRTMIGARGTGDDTSRFLALGVIGGLTGWLLASVFLHLSDFRALLLMAALAAVADVRQRAATGPPIAPAGRESLVGKDSEAGPRRPGRGAVVGWAGAALLGLVGVMAAGLTGHTVYTSSTTLGVVPTGAVGGATAYELDVVSRGLIVPTLAEVLDRSIDVGALAQQAGRFPAGAETTSASVDVAPSRLGGAVVVTVTADQPAVATDLTRAAVAASKATVDDLQAGYRLTGEPAEPQPVSSPPWWAVPALAVVTVLSGVMALVTARRRVRRRVDRRAPAATVDVLDVQSGRPIG
ncbi:O-antigen ligase family protein [Nakamurella sp.]|uniref:O-antigen ligase family protein n=1 Tax=Nakamurella sp. TaxID=1869182 RepID=UPI0037847265